MEEALAERKSGYRPGLEWRVRLTDSPAAAVTTALFSLLRAFPESQTTPSVLCKPNPQKRPSISNINLAGHPLTL
ncbi:hypothetical protein EJB05_08476, partial [Eragrostis curvula]